ncbi:MAG: zinc-ribbon domain-containing protein [Planctomycetaceae bacterium]|nr:zinc-ribbon domain-containing protein [Planctomycetaceae bacterium]
MPIKCPSCDHENPPTATLCSRCGAALPAAPDRAPPGAAAPADPLAERLAPLIAAGRTIEAIKHYREATGVGLAEAKSAVELYREQGKFLAATTSQVPLDPTQEQAILELLRAGKAIEAIRYYRQQRATDLKSAKEAIEAIARQNGIPLILPGPGSAIALVVVVAVGAVAVLGGALYWWSAS